MHRIDKRAEYTALVGLILQLICFGLLLVLFRVNRSSATLAESFHFLAGIGIWALIFIELYQARLASQQRAEIQDLERQKLQRFGGSESVFQGYSADEELPMERRLRILRKWFVPIIAVVIALVHVFLAARLMPSWWPMTWLKDSLEMTPAKELGTLSIIVGVAFVCFIMSRYCLGLSKIPASRALRAGANYIMGNALVCAVLAVTLALANFQTYMPEKILAKIIPVIMLILAAELLLNLIMDIYRPRIPGQEYRPSYESRLLGLFCEPEGVMRSIAHAIDYQFGFRVSETWFYQLLQDAIAPLVLFGAIVLYLMSCFVIVRPGQQAVVLHFGKKPNHVLREGMHYKWPWPIDVARIYPVDEVQQIVIGFTGQINWFNPEKATEPILWTVKHVTGEEFQLLVASKDLESHLKSSEKESEKSKKGKNGKSNIKMKGNAHSKQSDKDLSPVSILAGALIIHYNIDENSLLDYISNYKNPKSMLEAIAYREWTRYMASANPMGVMATQRDELTASLKKTIQLQLDKNHSGIRIIRIALVGMHPPVDVADAFEAAINARQERETLIWKAKGQANQKIPKAQADAAEIISSAEADRYAKVTIEKSKASRFKAQLISYKYAPNVFYMRKYLNMLVDATQKIRKYILAVKHPEKVLLIVDDKEKLPAGLLGLGEEVQQEVEKQSQ